MRFDVFIFHASEDKDAFVTPLAEELERLGMRVWYDNSMLSLGDSLRTEIDKGLVASRYGVVVLSHAFFKKHWTQKELDGLAIRERRGKKVILPVCHEITVQEVEKLSPMLAGRRVTYSSNGVKAVAQEIFEVIRGKARKAALKPENKDRKNINALKKRVREMEEENSSSTVNPPPVPASFQKIQRFVVLMLENRSFDHLVGFLKGANPAVAGLKGSESNYPDPNSPQSPPVTVGKATQFVMPFDPAHEFEDVQMQLYGPSNILPAPAPNPPSDPAAMSGFVANAILTAQAAGNPAAGPRIMECFQLNQLSVISTLAQQFALINYWYSSLPGPTWPNRFFVHAATSGGLTDSPTDDAIISGYSFPNGTIYERLQNAGKNWRIYHDGLPQSAGINSLRLEYLNPLTTRFKDMDDFVQDVKSASLPEYTFIEPNYDSGGNYIGGNSMHPLNDVREGEKLVKLVYETIRNSNYWADTMLVITFDEHGGFYDHVPPPATVPTGDDSTYADPARTFIFNRLGVRVPAIVISVYTQPGTIIGANASDTTTIFDHSSIPATVEKRFGLQALTLRDKAANTLDIALNLVNPRTDAPTALPDPANDTI